MKVWQGIGTIIISLIMAACLFVSAAYFVVDRSVLNEGPVKDALARSDFYGHVRSDKLLPAIQDQITEQNAELGGPLTQTDVIDSLRQAFPEDNVHAMTDTTLDATYAWLNKKSPDIDFTIDISSQKQAFLSALSNRVDTNLKALPECRSASQIADSLADVTCLSPYTTPAAYRDEIMEDVKARVNDADNTITQATVGLDTASLSGVQNLPDYLSYLWAVNLITLPLAGLLAIYLIVKRRSIGLLAVGIVVFALGLVCFILSILTPSLMIHGDAVIRSFADAVMPLAQAQLRLLALCGGGVGALMITGASVWLRAARRKQAEHYVSSANETD